MTSVFMRIRALGVFLFTICFSCLYTPSSHATYNDMGITGISSSSNIDAYLSGIIHTIMETGHYPTTFSGESFMPISSGIVPQNIPSHGTRAAEDLDTYLSGIIHTIIETGHYPNILSGNTSIPTTLYAPSQSVDAANTINEYLQKLIQEAIQNNTPINYTHIPKNICLGIAPSGAGVLKRIPAQQENYTVWTYSPDGYARDMKCTWTCYTGYKKHGNACIPIQSSYPTTPEQNILTTYPHLSQYMKEGYGAYLWKLVHQRVMMNGFRWIGDVETYITPDMYIGTPIRPPLKKFPSQIQTPSSEPNKREISPSNPLTSPGTKAYQACIAHEINASFGKDKNAIRSNDAEELKEIAKHCVRDAYGNYFYGKNYTTREEFLLLLSTAFGKNYSIPGVFSHQEYTHTGKTHPSSYNNIASNSWFSPLLEEGRSLGMADNGKVWTIAKEVSTNDIYVLLANTAHQHQATQSGSTYTWKHGEHTYTLEFLTYPHFHLYKK